MTRRNRLIALLLAIVMAVSGSFTALAEEAAGTAAKATGAEKYGTDEQYPLSWMKDWFVVNTWGKLDWKYSHEYLWEVRPELDNEANYNHEFRHTGTSEYIMQHALADTVENLNFYFGQPTGKYLVVVAKLAGVPLTGYEHMANDEKVLALEKEVRDFLNSFDWRNASDLEKAIQVARRITRADYYDDAKMVVNDLGVEYMDSGTCTSAYSCLVNGKAVCSGFTGAAMLLAFCVGLPVSTGGDIPNHVYPLFCINGVWVSYEPTTKDTTFMVIDPIETCLHVDFDPTKEVDIYSTCAEYCLRSGYVMPEDISGLIPDATIGICFLSGIRGGGTRQTIQFTR